MSDNVVSIKSARPSDDGNVSDRVTQPKSIAEMSETEADEYMYQLRERRMKATQLIMEQKEAKKRVKTASAHVKIETQLSRVITAEERAINALDKLEAALVKLRVLMIKHSD